MINENGNLIGYFVQFHGPQEKCEQLQGLHASMDVLINGKLHRRRDEGEQIRPGDWCLTNWDNQEVEQWDFKWSEKWRGSAVNWKRKFFCVGRS